MKEESIGGTFVGVKFDPVVTVEGLVEWTKNNITNPVKKEEFHSTLIFSSVKLKNFRPLGKIKPSWTAIPLQFKIWEVDEGLSHVLVLRINAPALITRHNQIMRNHPEAVYDFSEYNPHIALSYDIDPLFDVNKLSTVYFPKILITEEYTQSIKKGFGK